MSDDTEIENIDYNTSSDSNNERTVLARAIEERERCCLAHDQATTALQRADELVAVIEGEVKHAREKLDAIEAENAGYIAAAIRNGAVPHPALSDNIALAQEELARAESRRRMAMTAWDTIAEDAAEAERLRRDAERNVEARTADVILAEVEADYALYLEPALAALVEASDMVMAASRLSLRAGDGTIHPAPLPRSVHQAVARLTSLRDFIDRLRPQRPILAPKSEMVTEQRIRQWRDNLMTDPDAAFEDAPEPPLLRSAS